MNKLSILVLKIYSNKKSLTLNQLSAIMNNDWLSLAEPVSYLRLNGYLRINSTYADLKKVTDDSPIDLNTPLEITFEGKIVLESEHKLSIAKRNEWIRYIITTTVAVAAFIKSFLF